MAAESSRRKVELARAAATALREIWEWNAERYGPPHADSYLEFVTSAIESLAKPGILGRPVPHRPGVFYRVVRRRASGHGHILVYEAEESRVLVLRIFHTAQDWLAALAMQPPSTQGER